MPATTPAAIASKTAASKAAVTSKAAVATKTPTVTAPTATAVGAEGRCTQSQQTSGSNTANNCECLFHIGASRAARPRVKCAVYRICCRDRDVALTKISLSIHPFD